MSINVEDLPIGVFCGDVLPNGTVILGSNVDGKLYQSDDGLNFTQLFDMQDPSILVMGVLCDSRGYIFVHFSTNGGDSVYDRSLYRSVTPYPWPSGIAFQVVKEFGLEAPRHPVMAEDNSGNIYMSPYGRTTAAGEMLSEIWRTLDVGVSWELLYSDPFYVRHFHGIGVDPATGWIYGMAGESYTNPDGYHAYVIRSKNNGVTWVKIVKFGLAPNNQYPFNSKPPMGGPCFFKGKIYFGSDNFGNPNSLWRFQDLGHDTEQNYPIEKLADVVGPGGETPWIQWVKKAPGDSLILAGVGFMIWGSTSGEPGTWQVLYSRSGPNFMYSHKWRGGLFYTGGGVRNTTGLILSMGLPTYNLTVKTILRHKTGETEPLEGIIFEVP